jgi:bifunctional DNA-binding transcriptional regulator/antitoxin component of YhaV-PrlF toxin-antitoxin module
MKQIVANVTRKGQVTIPVEVLPHLDVGAPGKVAFVLEGKDSAAIRPARSALEGVLGSVPALPGRETIDFEDQIEEAMEEEAERIVADVEGR